MAKHGISKTYSLTTQSPTRTHLRDKMRQHEGKGVIHALTALEMGLKLCADHRQLSRVAYTRLTTTISRALDHVRLTGSKQWPALFIPTPSNKPGHPS